MAGRRGVESTLPSSCCLAWLFLNIVGDEDDLAAAIVAAFKRPDVASAIAEALAPHFADRRPKAAAHKASPEAYEDYSAAGLAIAKSHLFLNMDNNSVEVFCPFFQPNSPFFCCFSQLQILLLLLSLCSDCFPANLFAVLPDARSLSRVCQGWHGFRQPPQPCRRAQSSSSDASLKSVTANQDCNARYPRG